MSKPHRAKSPFLHTILGHSPDGIRLECDGIPVCTYWFTPPAVERTERWTDTERLAWLSKQCGGEGRLIWRINDTDEVSLLVIEDGQCLGSAIDAAIRAAERAAERKEKS